MINISAIRFCLLILFLSTCKEVHLLSHEQQLSEESQSVVEEVVDDAGIKSIITYDASGCMKKVEKYNASAKLISTVDTKYDLQGNKTLEQHSVIIEGAPIRLFTLHWTYDAYGRILSASEGNGTPLKSTRYVYQDQERICMKIKPDGTILTYCYNQDWLLASLKASDDSVNYLYHYDEKKRLIEVQDLVHDRKQTRRYGNSNEVVEEEIGNGVTMTHEYDELGNRVRTILPDHSQISYLYREGSLIQVERKTNRDSGNLIFEYSYDAELQPIRLGVSGRDESVYWSYHKNGQLSSIKSPWWSQDIVLSTDDPIANIVQSNTFDTAGSRHDIFEYSEDGQLLNEEGHQYAYDSLWNRVGHNGEIWESNSLNQLVRNPQAICSYNDNGCLSSKQTPDATYHLTYDALDRLIRVEKDGEFASEYIYDSFNRQIERYGLQKGKEGWNITSSDRYLYDGLKEIGRMNQEGCIVEFRLLGHGQGAELGAAIVIELNGHSYFPVHDHRGSVRCLVDLDNGQPIENYTYSSYGVDTSFDHKGEALSISSLANPWRFYSKRTDGMSQLVNFGFRWYDPQLAKWISPDPLFSQDCPNLYAFVKNDPVNSHDLYGLFSANALFDWVFLRFFSLLRDLQTSIHQYRVDVNDELKISAQWNDWFEVVGRHLFGQTYDLMGYSHERTRYSSYGQGEISDKVRVTFINGILTTPAMLAENLELISTTHGNVNVHYVFRPTEGWVWDISRAILIKAAYWLGFRSGHAHILKSLWRELIQDMGGVDGGGVIVHYAHSLGATETDRARELLTPEEQKMIRVITCGPATYVRNIGFQSVINHVSIDDGVGNNYLFEPIGMIRFHFGDPLLDVRFHGNPYDWPGFLMDHGFCGSTYGPLVAESGIDFLAEFADGITPQPQSHRDKEKKNKKQLQDKQDRN
jgi:RHS repeat-associated protein